MLPWAVAAAAQKLPRPTAAGAMPAQDFARYDRDMGSRVILRQGSRPFSVKRFLAGSSVARLGFWVGIRLTFSQVVKWTNTSLTLLTNGVVGRTRMSTSSEGTTGYS